MGNLLGKGYTRVKFRSKISLETLANSQVTILKTDPRSVFHRRFDHSHGNRTLTLTK